jgi:hypothetical protein
MPPGVERALWLLGAVRLIAAANLERLAQALARPHPLFVIVTGAAAALAAALWHAGYEGLRLDDDVYMATAAVFAALTGALITGRLRATRLG